MSATIQSLARKLLWLSLLWLCLLTMPFKAQAGQDTQAECLFNWAETNYASLFAPSGTPTVFSPDSTSRLAYTTKLRRGELAAYLARDNRACRWKLLAEEQL